MTLTWLEGVPSDAALQLVWASEFSYQGWPGQVERNETVLAALLTEALSKGD